MAVGDVVGAEALIITGVCGAAVTKGQIVTPDPDTSKFGPADAESVAGFGVAIDGGAENDEIRVLIFGRVRVAAGENIPAGAALDVGSGGGVVAHTTGVICGVAMESATNGGELTILVGIV